MLNFKLAAELAEDDGIEVQSVVLDDDVAVQDSLYTAGRRGTGATVLAEKIAGAKAEAGGSLAEVAGICRKVNDKARSFGVALTSCATPSSGTPDLRPRRRRDRGRRRHPRRAGPAAREAEAGRRDRRGDARRRSSSDLRAGRGLAVLAFVNGLGGTPLIELYLLFNEVTKQLDARGIKVGRSLVGSYITSLEMAGCLDHAAQAR